MKATVSPEMKKIWNHWFNYQDEESANQLIRHYMYLVDYHVERISAYIPSSFDKNDLISLGLLGLYDALQKFEPSRNLKFDTYATIRIKGSIIDGLRKEDWLPRSLREEVKKVEQTTRKLEQSLQRTPNQAEIAKKLGLLEDEVETIIQHSLFANMISIETVTPHQDADDSLELGERIVDDKTIQPEEYVAKDELKVDLARAVQELNKNEQLVISLFYVDELTLTEIGHVLNLTTSRISQIHKRAIFKLRDILAKVTML